MDRVLINVANNLIGNSITNRTIMICTMRDVTSNNTINTTYYLSNFRDRRMTIMTRYEGDYRSIVTTIINRLLTINIRPLLGTNRRLLNYTKVVILVGRNKTVRLRTNTLLNVRGGTKLPYITYNGKFIGTYEDDLYSSLNYMNNDTKDGSRVYANISNILSMNKRIQNTLKRLLTNGDTTRVLGDISRMNNRAKTMILTRRTRRMNINDARFVLYGIYRSQTLRQIGRTSARMMKINLDRNKINTKTTGNQSKDKLRNKDNYGKGAKTVTTRCSKRLLKSRLLYDDRNLVNTKLIVRFRRLRIVNLATSLRNKDGTINVLSARRFLLTTYTIVAKDQFGRTSLGNLTTYEETTYKATEEETTYRDYYNNNSTYHFRRVAAQGRYFRGGYLLCCFLALSRVGRRGPTATR